jgi:hypothetical protein
MEEHSRHGRAGPKGRVPAIHGPLLTVAAHERRKKPVDDRDKRGHDVRRMTDIAEKRRLSTQFRHGRA